MNILIYDGVCPKEYSTNSVKSAPVGGTEATVLRVASGLVDRGFDVTIEQRHREGFVGIEGLSYVPLNSKEAIKLADRPSKVDVVITLRDAGQYVANIARFPKAKHYLWLHDVVSGDYREHLLAHLLPLESKVHVVCVSDFHKVNVIEGLKLIAEKGNLRVTRIYNPIATYATKDPTRLIDDNKLVFFSSPHKGLQEVATMFQMARRIDPALKLYVANPGYYPDAIDMPEGMINLGVLTHEKVLDHVRDALCVFYPNFTFAETFGLVMAEANAVGTPVIAHNFGAAPEVLEHPHQLMDCRQAQSVVDRVLHWKAGNRPVVSGRAEFRLGNVIKDWVKLFDRTK